MVFTQNQLPNLVDWANMVDPDGTVADLAWMLAQCNDILKDVIWQEGNMPMGHQVSLNVGLPQGTWRQNNQGVAATKPINVQAKFAISELVDYSMVDKLEASMNGELAKFRWTQDQSHIMGISQQVAQAFIYSNQATNISQFTGIMPFYATVNTANAQSANNVIDAGGTGSSNSSILLLGWGDDTIHGLFPKGSPAGLIYEDKGDTTPLYDSNGNRFEGYTSYFAWRVGLCVKNWEYAVRICNIDTTTAGIKGTSPPDLFVLMAQAVKHLPTLTRRASGITEVDSPGDPMPGIRPAFYVNRTIGWALDTQAMRDKNVLLSLKDFAGDPVTAFRDIPIRNVDMMTTTESRIT